MEDCYKTGNSDRYQLLKFESKRMRAVPTDAEKHLWNFLRAGNLGVKFRRQHPIDDYIADFVCLSKCLIVEVDGKIHEREVEHDTIRDERLRSLGYTTLRFTNEQVLTNVESVLDTIKQNIK